MFIKGFLEKYQEGDIFLVPCLNEFIKNINLIMPLINSLSNITFFIKNTEVEYLLVNDFFLERSGYNSMSYIVGKTSAEVFLCQFGVDYKDQDLEVIKRRSHIFNRLELHNYKNGLMGWCMTSKIPIFNTALEVVGLVGISIDLQEDKVVRADLNIRLNRVLEYINQNFRNAISVDELADIAHLSVSQLTRQFREIFMVTPLQMIQKKRFEHAAYLLSKDLSITEVSMECGYIDHSAFSRKFKEITNMTPREFKSFILR